MGINWAVKTQIYQTKYLEACLIHSVGKKQMAMRPVF